MSERFRDQAERMARDEVGSLWLKMSPAHRHSYIKRHAKTLADSARTLERAGLLVVDPGEPSTGKEYEAGEWSRRNFESWVSDHRACRALEDRIASYEPPH